MSSNDRYRGNREYRDLKVQTHYGKSGRSPRVQTNRPFDSDMKFSQNSADFRRPYEDREFIDRSRANAAGQQRRPQQRQPQPQQQPLPYQVDPRQYYDRQIQKQNQGQGQQPYRQPQPQQHSRNPYQNGTPAPAPRKVAKNEPGDMRRMKSDYVVDEGMVALNMKPKVGKEQVLQIDMIFKIGIMVWAAAALVTVIVLLT